MNISFGQVHCFICIKRLSYRHVFVLGLCGWVHNGDDQESFVIVIYSFDCYYPFFFKKIYVIFPYIFFLNRIEKRVDYERFGTLIGGSLIFLFFFFYERIKIFKRITKRSNE